MFTPLTFQKNAAIQVDRLDNSGITPSTSAKKLGYGLPSNSYLLTERGNDTTFVVQAWPNSDVDSNLSGGDGHNWVLTQATATGCSSNWWMLSIPTDNNTEPGPAGNYPTLLGTDGIKKGQLCINSRLRPACTGDRDWVGLINSGSIYDWDDPQPITVAIGLRHSDETFVCAVNGVSASVVFENRNNKTTPAISGLRGFNDLIPPTTTDPDTNSRPQDMNLGYSSLFSTEVALSGSFSEWVFYDRLLTMDEMKLVTNQPYGQPLNVIDTEPTLHFRFREELKVTTTAAFVPEQIENKAFDNLGTQTGADVNQMQSVVGPLGGVLDSGSVMNTQVYEYQDRV